MSQHLVLLYKGTGLNHKEPSEVSSFNSVPFLIELATTAYIKSIGLTRSAIWALVLKPVLEKNTNAGAQLCYLRMFTPH